MVCAPHRYIIDSIASGGVGYNYRSTAQYDPPKAYQPAYPTQTYSPITREMLPLQYQRAYYTSVTPDATGITQQNTLFTPETKPAEERKIERPEDTMKPEQTKPETPINNKNTKQDLARKILNELDKLGREEHEHGEHTHVH